MGRWHHGHEVAGGECEAGACAREGAREEGHDVNRGGLRRGNRCVRPSGVVVDFLVAGPGGPGFLLDMTGWRRFAERVSGIAGHRAEAHTWRLIELAISFLK